MAVTDLFRELAIANSGKQPGMVDTLLEEAPILAMMPMQPSTHGFSNVFEKLSDVTGAGMIDIDDELPEIATTSELLQTDLSILGGTMFVGEDKAKKLGGAASYFSNKMPTILSKTGEDVEKAILYNNIRAFAIDNDNVEDAGGTGAVNYSIIAVTWKRGEITGLYDPESYGNGKVFDIQAINGGALYEKTIGSKTILGYGTRIKSTLGIQLNNHKLVSGIVNIDLDDDTPKPPTERAMDKLLLDCRGNNSTVIYMHPRVLTELYNYKSSRLQMSVGDRNVDRVIGYWNGTPIVTSYNFLNALEAKVTVA
jgi:hypothetical protein